MAEIVEIKEYRYYFWSSRESADAAPLANIMLYDKNGEYIGFVSFTRSGRSLLPARKLSSGIYALYYEAADLPGIIDMLRNEKPVYLRFNGGINSCITTSKEPTGEEESGTG